MNSKERILTTLNHKEPDKVPIDSWLTPEIYSKLLELFDIDLSNDPVALEVFLGDDLLYRENLGIDNGFNTIFMPERKIEGEDNLFVDPWGIKWKRINQKYGSYGEMVEHPLADIKKYDNYKLPDPDSENLDEYELIIKKYGKSHAILGSAPCSILEASWYLRGLENFMMDLLTNKDFVNDIMDKVMEYHLHISKKLVKMGVDIIWWGDDIGCENGPFIPPESWKEFLVPRYSYMVQEVKKINKNIKIAFHTDGYIEYALDDFIEIGFDIINPLQPKVNNVEMIKKKYGKKLTFWGNVDTRDVLSHGNAEDIINEIKNVIRVLAPGGGLILCTNHAIQSTERSLDNTILYYWAAKKLRNYPIKF